MDYKAKLAMTFREESPRDTFHRAPQGGLAPSSRGDEKAGSHQRACEAREGHYVGAQHKLQIPAQQKDWRRQAWPQGDAHRGLQGGGYRCPLTY